MTLETTPKSILMLTKEGKKKFIKHNKKIYSWKEWHLNWAPLAIVNKLPKLFERNLDENDHTIARLNQLLSYVWFPSLYPSLSRNMFCGHLLLTLHLY